MSSAPLLPGASFGVICSARTLLCQRIPSQKPGEEPLSAVSPKSHGLGKGRNSNRQFGGTTLEFTVCGTFDKPSKEHVGGFGRYRLTGVGECMGSSLWPCGSDISQDWEQLPKSNVQSGLFQLRGFHWVGEKEVYRGSAFGGRSAGTPLSSTTWRCLKCTLGKGGIL